MRYDRGSQNQDLHGRLRTIAAIGGLQYMYEEMSEGCRQRYKTATTERQRCMPAVKILPRNSDFIGLPENN